MLLEKIVLSLISWQRVEDLNMLAVFPFLKVFKKQPVMLYNYWSIIFSIQLYTCMGVCLNIIIKTLFKSNKPLSYLTACDETRQKTHTLMVMLSQYIVRISGFWKNSHFNLDWEQQQHNTNYFTTDALNIFTHLDTWVQGIVSHLKTHLIITLQGKFTLFRLIRELPEHYIFLLQLTIVLAAETTRMHRKTNKGGKFLKKLWSVGVLQDNLVLSTSESFHGGQFTLSTQLIKPN